VIDFREDKNADTGYFELAYKQRMPSSQPLGVVLSLQGTRIITERKPSGLVQDPRISLATKFPMVIS